MVIAFSSKIDYLCFRVIQLCEVWGIRLIDFRNQFVTHPFLSLILQFVNQRDSLNGNNPSHVSSNKFIRDNVEYAYLDNALWDLLQDKDIRELMKSEIVRFFKLESNN